ncbi:hypothetical protein VPH35_043391 [Triticum aestivum]
MDLGKSTGLGQSSRSVWAADPDLTLPKRFSFIARSSLQKGPNTIAHSCSLVSPLPPSCGGRRQFFGGRWSKAALCTGGSAVPCVEDFKIVLLYLRYSWFTLKDSHFEVK